MKTHTRSLLLLLVAAFATIALSSCAQLDKVLGPTVSNRDPATGQYITPNCPTVGLPLTLSATIYVCPNGHLAHAVGGVPLSGKVAAVRVARTEASADYPLPVVTNRDARGQFITPKWRGKASLWQATVYQAPSGHAYQSPWIVSH